MYVLELAGNSRFQIPKTVQLPYNLKVHLHFFFFFQWSFGIQVISIWTLHRERAASAVIFEQSMGKGCCAGQPEPEFVNLLMSPGIDSDALRAVTTTLFDIPARQAT
jgi:hypothetical protein